MSSEDKKKESDGFADRWLGEFAKQFSELTLNADLSEAEFRKKTEQLLAEPPIDTDVFAAAVQRELAAGYLAGMREARRNSAPEET